MNRTFRLAAAAACALALSSVVACSAEVSVGSSSNLDIDKLEKKLTTELEKNATDKIATMECPEDEKGDKGDTFVCSFESDAGARGDIDIEVTDDKGNVDFKTDPESLSYSGETVAENITEDFGTTYPDQAASLEDVECPEDVPATPGSSTVCTLTSADGQTGDLNVVSEEAGKLNWDFETVTPGE